MMKAHIKVKQQNGANSRHALSVEGLIVIGGVRSEQLVEAALATP